MNLRPRASRLAAILATALLLAPVPLRAEEPALRAGETVRETSEWFGDATPRNADGSERYWAVRILDATTRLPIHGARVEVPYHWQRGVPADLLHHLCVGTSNERGWIFLPWESVQGWEDYAIADATGYAANEYCTPGDDDCELTPAVDVPFVLLDYVGRPVPHARLALNLGCGHIPDQRTATADATGRGTLRDVDPSRHKDIWIDAPGLHFGTGFLGGTWRESSPPVEIHGVPGRSTKGRILDADDRPLARVEVGRQHSHRPWTRTDKAGRFTLSGLEPWPRVEVRLPRRLGGGEVSFAAAPEGVERTYRVGETVGGHAVTVRVTDAGGAAAGEVRVVAVRDGNGATTVGKTDDDGVVTLDLAPGAYRVFADGELGVWGRAESRTQVGAGGAAEARVTIARNATLRVDGAALADLMTDEVRVAVTTARQFHALDEETVRAGVIPVPTERPATIRVSGWEDGELIVRFFEIADRAEDAPPPVLDWHPATRVMARLVGPGGQPISGRLRLVRDHREWSFHGDDDGEATLTPGAETRLVGAVDWVVLPEDENLVSETGTIQIDMRGDQVDLGEVRCRPAAAGALQIELPPGLIEEPDPDAKPKDPRRGYVLDDYIPDDPPVVTVGYVTIHRADEEYEESAKILADGSLDEPLRWISPQDTVAVWLDVDDCLLFTTHVPDTPPPWTIRYPPGSLRLTVRGSHAGSDAESGPLFGAVVIVDDHVIDRHVIEEALDDTGALFLRGLAAGRHEIVIAASGHLAKIYELIWAEGEERTLDVTLAPRPEE